jgi:hypothetical protein
MTVATGSRAAAGAAGGDDPGLAQGLARWPVGTPVV